MNLINILTNCNEDTNACVGVIGEKGIPGDLVNIIHYVYIAIQIVVPILLILFGMIELAKAIVAQKEDEIKKAQGSFFKKLIVAVIIFLVFSIVKLVFNFATSGKSKENIWTCASNIINGHCDESSEANDSKNES